MKHVVRRITHFFSSRLFWYIILGLFLVQALWFVFSAVYPMPFDEDFHLGVIRIYAAQWSPFLDMQPPGADQFGALARDPSYFFHYVMSFPYRAMAAITASEAAQVIVLRLINVALFVYGLVLFRKLLLRANISSALTHVIVALFTLVPIVPQLAAHINYDNVLMVLLPLLCLTTVSLAEGLQRRRVNAAALLGFVATALYVSVVKYAALPFLIVAILFVLGALVVYFRHAWHSLLPAIKSGFRRTKQPLLVALVALCALGAILFAQRYVVNIARYKTPVPDCGQVLSTEQCTQYGPWGRDYYFAQSLPTDFEADPLVYMGKWLRGMWYRLFFAVSGPKNEYANYPPLTVPGAAAIGIAILGLLATICAFQPVFRGNMYLILFAGMSLVYCLILWFEQFGMYQQTGQPVAINGRYLLPILPLVAAVFGKAIAMVLGAFPRIPLLPVKAVLATVALLLFLHGGGVLTFILRSDDSWYWPNHTVQAVNHAARNLVSPVVIEGSREELHVP